MSLADHEIDEPLDKYPTHCDLHNEHRPCAQCRDMDADRRYDEQLEKRDGR